MILYTPLAESDIFPNEDNNSNRLVIKHQEKPLYVEKGEDGNYQILQLLSTDPNDFMDPQYQPGSTLPSIQN